MIKRFVEAFRRSGLGGRRPDVVLHIGAPKCGSSAIQRFCVSRREALLQHGYYYPEHSLDVNGVSGGHTQVAGALVNGKRDQARTAFRRFLEEARTHDACLLLSAEALYGQHAALAEFCDGVTVRIVGFLRNPVEYLLANHNQGIKRHMSTQRLGEAVSEFLHRPTGHLVGVPLLMWADAFGDENCTFIPYRSPSNGGAMVERQFLNALGLERKAATLLQGIEGQTNRSYVRTALELKRLLNTVLEALPEQCAHEVDWSLQGYSDRALDEFPYSMSDLDPVLKVRINEHLMAQMDAVVIRFPALKTVAEPIHGGASSDEDGWLNLGAPLAWLERDAPQVLREVRKHAAALRDQGRGDYAFLKLLDVLGIDFREPVSLEKLKGFSAQQRTLLSGDNVHVPDCLREMAVVFEEQGLLQDALFAISRALELRPNGLGIQRIKERIEDKLSLSAVDRGAVGSSGAEAAGS